MDSLEIGNILKKVPEFEGVFAIDTLPPYVRRFPCTYVVNTDKRKGKGQHWICLYFDQAGSGYLFDSFGRHPEYYNLVKHFDQNCHYYNFNTQCLQSPFSSICGAYCIYYILMKHASVKQWITPFSGNLILNDCIVIDFVNRFADE